MLLGALLEINSLFSFIKIIEKLRVIEVVLQPKVRFLEQSFWEGKGNLVIHAVKLKTQGTMEVTWKGKAYIRIKSQVKTGFPSLARISS